MAGSSAGDGRESCRRRPRPRPRQQRGRKRDSLFAQPAPTAPHTSQPARRFPAARSARSGRELEASARPHEHAHHVRRQDLARHRRRRTAAWPPPPAFRSSHPRRRSARRRSARPAPEAGVRLSGRGGDEACWIAIAHATAVEGAGRTRPSGHLRGSSPPCHCGRAATSRSSLTWARGAAPPPRRRAVGGVSVELTWSVNSRVTVPTGASC